VDGSSKTPPDVIRDAIVNGGKAILARRKAAEDDQPVELQEAKPPVPRSVGRPKQPEPYVSGVVGTLLKDDKGDKSVPKPPLPQ